MKVIIEPYSPTWAFAYEKEKAIIIAALADMDPVVEHIGSTSIPGLSSKPIIDILVGLQEEINLDVSIQPMQQAGYAYNKTYEPLMPYRRYFLRYADVADENNLFKSITHIHLIHYNTEHWIRHIAFRDYLKAYNDVCRQYENLKLQLSQQEFENSLHYNDAKNAFIQDVQQKAVQWYTGQTQ